MNCEFAEEQILAAFDGPLSEPDRRALDVHVSSCESCSKFQAIQAEADQILAAKFAELEPDASLAYRIRDAAFEPPPSRTPAWLPDALNAAGVAAMVGVFGALGLGGTHGTVVLLGVLSLIGIACYPLLLMKTE
jgi:anti-sigma factor RsiW